MSERPTNERPRNERPGYGDAVPHSYEQDPGQGSQRGTEQPYGWGGHQGPPPGWGGAAATHDGRPTAPGFLTATMGRRLGARLLDGLVLGVPAAAVIAALIAWVGMSAQETGEPATASVLLVVLVVYVIIPLAAVAYEVVLTARGGTLGKRWLGMRVVQRGTGALPGVGPALLRWLLFFASSFVILVGTALMALSPFFDNSGLRQGWHDLVAGTRVVDVRPGAGGRSPDDA